jgi:hypothetical protein
MSHRVALLAVEPMGHTSTVLTAQLPRHPAPLLLPAHTTQGAQHSAQIFSLAVLLSSIFVYNQVGAIDAIAIERLAMVCELAKRIKDRSAAPPPQSECRVRGSALRGLVQDSALACAGRGWQTGWLTAPACHMAQTNMCRGAWRRGGRVWPGGLQPRVHLAAA